LCLCSQIDEVPEGFSMVLKFIGFHITVLSHVSSKRRGTTEGFLIVQIFIWFCSSECHHTYLQVYGTLEDLTRVLRFKGILSTVHPHMFLKGAVTSECLSPVCFFICTRRDEENLYAFPHSLHFTCPPSVCSHMY